jgi:hypothetical protein
MVIAAALGLALSLGTPAVAGLSQSSVTAPGGFIQAGAYASTCGCGFALGGDMTATYGLGEDFHEGAFAGLSSVQRSASFSGSGIASSAAGTVGMGLMRMTAMNTFPSTAFFSAAVVQGGWKETFTVSHPSLNGQAGWLVFQIRVRGSMQVTGVAGATTVAATAYKDGAVLQVNALFDRGNSDPISTSEQYVAWSVASSGTPDGRTVDGTATMAAPITFGVPFTLGVYAMARAGQRSSGGFGAYSDSILDFSGFGVEWAGIASVQSGGGAVTGSTIVSGTGKDWGIPYDADGDGAANNNDCAPFDPGAFAAPGAVTAALFAVDGETFSWTSLAPQAGSGTLYDVMRGDAGEFPVGSGGSEFCLAGDLQATSTTDTEVPSVGGAFYYLVRARNACGTGSYGFASGGAERIGPACP